MYRQNWELLQWLPIVGLGLGRGGGEGTSPALCSVIGSVAIPWSLLEMQNQRTS